MTARRLNPRHSWRIRHGLHWQATNPRLYDYPHVKTYAVRLLLVAGAWAWAMNAQYREEIAAERAEKAMHVRQIVDCLNGELRLVAEDGTEVGCHKAEINRPIGGKP